MSTAMRIKEFFSWIQKSFQYAWQLRPGQDYDYDYIYILKLLRYKMVRTAKQIQKNRLIEDYQLTHDDIMDLVRVLDRMIADDYIYKSIDVLEELEPEELEYICALRERQKERDYDYFFKTLRDKIQSFWE